ncbi:glycosyltransferase [Ruicaihuangia caeni]|uniref:glycosyltransferase n=1 Tax=Ruicaihuangia caeni TaxID=3042517 RepID=UPI00338EF1CC
MADSGVDSPLVSVVLVNFRGADDTIEAVRHLAEVDWPASSLEIVVVENGSGDDSAARLRTELPGVTLVESPDNLGFAGGCNLGVKASRGEFVAFLNSDAKPGPKWVSAAVEAFRADAGIAAVASRVLDWNGETVDYVGSALTWFGKGYKPFVGDAASGVGLDAKDVLFGTGSAMFVRRDAYLELGGFDERFFMFYEDVDFGWRLNLSGRRFRYEPSSIAYHRHHAAADKFGSHRERYFLERNALFALYKNLEQQTLDAILPAALSLAIRRSVAEAGLDSTSYDYRSAAHDERERQEPVSREVVATVYAIDQFVEQLPGLTRDRDAIQASRRISDRAIWSLFGRVDAVAADDKSYLGGYRSLVDAFPVLEPAPQRRVLIITGDPIGVKMAGPAIRAWNMAAALAEHGHAVTLVTLARLETGVSAPFELKHVRAGDNRAFEPLEQWADIVVFQGHAMAAFDALQHTSKIVVADIYDPMHLEQLEQGRELPAATWDKQVADATRVMNQQLAKADFFLCASDRQRLFYLGQLSALGRINPANYHDDPDLERLIALAPFGLDSTAPRHERQVLKGVLPGIGEHDKVLLWGGGLYNWFDPKSLIRAVAALAERRDGVRLFFQGTKHPHPGVPEMAIVRESRALAAELGVLDRAVFFNDSWVEFADRQNYLTEADAGVSTHFAHVETTFSFRTRILDYLWAELPMVVTDGDSFADLVRSEELGVVVPADDVGSLTEALERILFDDELIARSRENIRRVRERFFWSNTLEPLVRFVADPRRAPDLVEQRMAAGEAPTERRRTKKAYGLAHNVSLAMHHLRHGGPRVVVRKVVARLRSR